MSIGHRVPVGAPTLKNIGVIKVTRDEIKAIVIETLKELVSGVIKNEPEQDADGDEWNNYVFDGEEFVDRILKYKPKSIKPVMPPPLSAEEIAELEAEESEP